MHLTVFSPMFVTVSPPQAPYCLPDSGVCLIGVFVNAAGCAMESQAPESMVKYSTLSEVK